MDISSSSFLALSCGYIGYVLINQIYTYQLVCEWTSQKKALYAVKNIFAVCKYDTEDIMKIQKYSPAFVL